MTPQKSSEGQDRIEQLYRSALQKKPADRADFLAEACLGDDALRTEVERLLLERQKGGSPVETREHQVSSHNGGSFAPGTRFGPYTIVSPAGAGGMGEVFKALDTRLNRLVAIKTLHVGWGSDPNLRARFEREAKTLAGLQHSHICALYDIGRQDGLDYLVMEYLEGETLADRLERGALKLADALRLAIEVASALDQAHRRGITHRDLKPGNIMLTTSGAKLLDFGLAKAQESRARSNASQPEATQTQALTDEGSIVGTYPYMSPEQLEGKEADARSDVFAFGAVVYEMATGRRAFAGKSQASVVAAILTQEPTPIVDVAPVSGRAEYAALDRVVRTCLKKDPEQRWQTAGELLHTLQWISEEKPQPRPAPRRTWLPWAITGSAVAGLLAFLAVAGWFPRMSAPRDAARFALPSPDGTITTEGTNSLAISPDGRNLALLETDRGGRNHLWIRPLGAASARRLEHTEDSAGPVWSPDGQFLLFSANRRVKRIAVSGGPAQPICEECGGPAAWGADGFILLIQNGRLVRMPATGGESKPVTELDKELGELSHTAAQLLPDGKSILYFSRNGNPAKSGIYVQEIGSSRRTLLMNTQWKAAFSPTGHLLFIRNGTLLAQSMDLKSYQLRGEPTPVADEVAITPTTPPGTPLYSVSSNGVLAYRSSHELLNRQLVWYGRDGKREQVAGEPGWYTAVKLSPDDKNVAVARRTREGPYADIWQLELASGIFSRRTFDPSIQQIDPLWSPDSRRFAIAAFVGSHWEIREVLAASGATTTLYSDTGPVYLGDWSRDGRFLVFHNTVGGGTTVYLLPLFGERKAQVLHRGRFTLDQFHFSPDGRWLAYTSNESGHHEVYIASLPSFAERRQVSTGGGVQPSWRNDGKELYYLSFDGRLMASDVKLTPSMETGIPKPLFQTNVSPAFGWDLYAATGDGKKFLMVESSKKAAGEVNVVLNWNAGLPR